MLIKLIIIFIVIPLLEFYILIKLGVLIGAFNTILIILFTGISGAYLVKVQGFKVINQIASDLKLGIFPADSLFDGLFILIGAVLLITPGLITDLTGILCILPLTRQLFKKMLKAYINTKLQKEGVINIKWIN